MRMIILGIEQSSSQNSIVMLEDGEVLANDSWGGKASRNQELFPRVETLLSSVSFHIQDLDMFAVGLGPGSFTGVRMALSTVNAMAQPDSKKVVGVGSADCIAESLMRETEAGSIAVVGDARRERFWCAVFSSEKGLPVVQSECRLVPKDEIEAAVECVDLVVSPEWERVGDVLTNAASGRCVKESRYPAALSCARIALARGEAVSGDSPSLPIYLHPAVVRR